MKLKGTFEPVDMGDEIVMVPVGKTAGKVQGIVKLDPGGKEILDLLTAYDDEDEVVRELSKKYENDAKTLKAYVSKVAAVLRDNGLTEE